MTSTPHFETAASWKAARAMLNFRPVEPAHTAGFQLQSIQIHVRDHKGRELGRQTGSLEAHYGAFVLTQARKGIPRRGPTPALDVSYGRTARTAQIAGHQARARARAGTPPGDIDGRRPSVVVWHDGDMFYLIASGEMSSDKLVEIAISSVQVTRA
jgi:hypothetical protein